jgi:glycosyltransferase involved in cell wall biosynthesis
MAPQRKGCNMPLVSIITPVYNAAPWLPETFASVCAQTFTDWEQILVDDGSTDGSLDMIEATAAEDPRFRWLRTSGRQGPAVARNTALEAARGRFIAFLDADDLWHPEKLARAVDWMTTHGYGFIYHDYRHMSRDGALVGPLITGPEVLDFRALHTRRGHGGCLSIVIDRERVPGFRFPIDHRYINEDFIAWMNIIKQGENGHRLPADLGRYRLSAQSRSANKRRAVLDSWRIYRQFSKLSVPRAALWWTIYVWNSIRLYRYARPR